MSVGRGTVGYLYTLELVPLSYQPAIGTSLQFFSSSVTVLATIYFYFISKYWVWLQLFGWTLNLITIVGVIFMPESPKFLLTMKKYDECRKAMTIIGRFNGNKNDFDGKFDQEIQDLEP